MKRSLNWIIFQSSVHYDELVTLIIEIVGIMDSQPLTYISSDVEEVLTPGQLIIWKQILDENWEPLNKNVTSDLVYDTKRVKYLKSLSTHYWKCWENEYLLELRRMHTQDGGNRTVITIREVVVINDQIKRHL